jgi:hypothetical protein
MRSIGSCACWRRLHTIEASPLWSRRMIWSLRFASPIECGSSVGKGCVSEWRRLLRGPTTQAHTVLQRVLRGKITFTPRADGAGYDFSAPTGSTSCSPESSAAHRTVPVHRLQRRVRQGRIRARGHGGTRLRTPARRCAAVSGTRKGLVRPARLERATATSWFED